MNSHNDYWLEQLAPFKMRSKVISSEHGRAREGYWFAESPMDFPASSSSEVLVSALALLWARYSGTNEVLITAESPGKVLLYRIEYVPEESTAAFVSRVRTEIEQSVTQAAKSFVDVLQVPHPENAVLYGVSDTRWPIAIGVSVCSEGVRLLFDSGRYSHTFAAQLVAHYCHAVAFLIKESEASLRQLDLLSPSDRVRLLAFNASARESPKGKLLHGLVEEQSARTPNAVAVVYRHSRLTYSELNGRANGLAVFLRTSLGVQTGDVVGLIVGRSELMILAILGVLKAGASYVPIDPRHPPETVTYVLQNTNVRTLLVNSDTVASAAGFRGELYVLDVAAHELPDHLTSPSVSTTETDIAYVIYTSGSTGRPKGVAVEHRAIVNTVLWRNEYYGMDEHDATLQVPSYAFDSAVADIFCSLSSGGELVIPEEALKLDSKYITGLIRKHSITRFLVTPSYYAFLNRELKGTTGIRSVTVAGESTSVELVAEHHRNLPGVRLVNEYGPTENAVCSTAGELNEGSSVVHIGRPVANTQVFVLDQDLKQVPIGVSGEMYLAGAGLARGYINQQSLTDDRFVVSSVPEFPGRMYRTGDRARWLSDGTLEFLGRLDDQVKIRGFRIELRQVEQALLKHPDVEAAVVLCKQDPTGEKYLAAYAASSSSPSQVELSEWLRQLLPYYMVPAAIHVMHRLPLNLNGKVDTATLAMQLDFGRCVSGSARGGTVLEESLASLCSVVLDRGKIGLDDHFFEVLGATSLKVMQIVTRIRADLKATVDLQDIYTYPTVRDLSARIETRTAAPAVEGDSTSVR